MLSDLKYAFRQLRKNRLMTGAVVASLALCLGINALIFSMLYAAVLRPLPFSHAGQLVEIYRNFPKLNRPHDNGTVPQMEDYARHPELFSGAGMYLSTGATLGDPAGPVRIGITRVSPDLFATLGVKPVVGRFFDAENTAPASSNVVVLTYSYWKSQYGADPGVLGRTLILNDQTCTIIGVAPASVEYFMPGNVLYVCQTWDSRELADDIARLSRSWDLSGRIFARLRPGITLEQASAQVNAIERTAYDHGSARYRHFADASGYNAVVHGLQEEQTTARKGTLYLLEAGALMVLLIGCVNVANLLLARALGRQSEFAIRHALGASRWQMFRQMLMESVLLSLLGGLAGASLSTLGVGLVNRYAGSLLGYGVHVRIDWTLLASAVGLAGLAGVAAGTLPGLQTLRGSLTAGIQQSSRNTSRSRRGRLFGSLLASSQIGLSLVLLVASGLLIRSLSKALAVDPGFDAAQITTARMALPNPIFSNRQNVFRIQAQIQAALEQIPGVDAVGMATYTPTVDIASSAEVAVYGRSSPDETVHRPVNLFTVSPGYFGAMGIRLLSGRRFDDRDNAQTATTIMVDRRFAQRFFPGQDPIGRKVGTYPAPANSESNGATIVGVVENVPYAGLDDLAGVPFAYIPIQRAPHPGTSFFVRSRRSAEDLVPLIRSRIQAVLPSVPVYETGSMTAFVDGTLDWRRGVLMLLTSFAATALVLSAVGVYGVLAYDVSQRVREIGIRGALGASHRQIVGLIVRQGLSTVGLGMGAGFIGVVWLGQLIASRLFEVSPFDPPTLGAIALLLLGIGTVASLLPAWRAAKIDPVVALRVE